MTRLWLRGCLAAASSAALIVCAGCGGASSGGQTIPSRSFNSGGDARYTEGQVARLAGFKSDGGVAYVGPQGCSISVIMTTQDEVQTYADAGDPVVTNRRGDVGVKFDAVPGCRARLLHALERVP